MNEEIKKCLLWIKVLIAKTCDNCPDKEPLCSLHCILGHIYHTIEENLDE